MSTESVLQNSGRMVGGVPQKPPVLGGSGRQYWTIRDALAGEAALAVTVAGVVPQAGSQAGVVVFQAGQSAVDNFYKDQYVLNTDTTPTNGLVAQWARVSDYVGATRTATLDKPWDFSAESDVSIIQPARISLNGDVEEDVTVTIPLELNLQGHRLRGKLDITGGGFCWIKGGSGYITNGIQKTDFGLLKIDDATVSRRDATIYALLMTEGSDLGRTEINNCEFMGRVAGRRGYSGWNVKQCKGLGIPSNSNFDNLPYTLVESIGAVAITLSAIDIEIDSEFGGAFFYTENNITGGASYINVFANIVLTEDYMDLTPTPRTFSVVRGVGACTFNVTQVATSRVTMFIAFARIASGTPLGATANANLVSAESMTGSMTYTINSSAYSVSLADQSCTWNNVVTEGNSNSSGSVVVNGSGSLVLSGTEGSAVVMFRFGTSGGTGALTGSVSFANSITVNGCTFQDLVYGVAHTVGAPSSTRSAAVTHRGNGTVILNTGVSISVGTYTISGNTFSDDNFLPPVATWGSGVSGGTWTFSGVLGLSFKSSAAGAIAIFTYTGTGGSASVSNRIALSKGDVSGLSTHAFLLATCNGNGGSVTLSGTVVVGFMGLAASLPLIARNVAAGGTCAVTGTVIFSYCIFEVGTITFINATTAGGTAQGPATLEFNYCVFKGAVTTQSGSGTNTWSGATIRYRHCHIDGLYTVVYTAFTTHEAYHSRFNGASANKSIAGSGTRPTTLRYWACTAAQRYDDILPEWITVYDVLPAQAALVQGQPVKVNAANQYQVCVAASIVDGVLLAAAGGAGTFAVNVRHGRVFVAAKAGTANGDNLALDLATPTQTNLAAFTPGQNVGTALEAVGTTVAGKSYAAVNVR